MSPLSTIDTSRPAIPFRTLVKVELRKLVDTRAGYWLLVATALISVALMTLIVTTGSPQHLNYANFFGMLNLPTTTILPVLAILLVTSETSQRTGLVTFALEPRRGRTMAAKLATSMLLAVAALVLAAVLAAVGTVASVMLREGVVHEWNMSWEVLRNAGLVQCARLLQAFGFAALLMSSAAAIVAYFALPTAWFVIGSTVPWIHDHLARWVDFSSAQGPLQNGDAPFRSAHAVTGTEWAQLAVSGFIWVVLPLVLGLVRLRRTEVK